MAGKVPGACRQGEWTGFPRPQEVARGVVGKVWERTTFLPKDVVLVLGRTVQHANKSGINNSDFATTLFECNWGCLQCIIFIKNAWKTENKHF